MSDFSPTPFLDLASKTFNIKKTETTLPIARTQAVVSQLSVGDDVSLRSGLVSPVAYDRDLIKILHDHSIFQGPEENYKLNYSDFCRTVSNADKLSLMWAIYKCTYELLAKDRLITCPSENCKQSFKDEIYLSELIQQDTFTIWEEYDEENNIIPFYEYIYPIKITDGNLEYTFNTCVPTIQQNNILLGLLDISALQENLQKTGMLYTRAQQMALLTQTITLKDTATNTSQTTSDLNEILIFCQSYIPHNIYNKYIEAYEEKFATYVPKFYKKYNCPSCGFAFDYNVDLEVEFFRRIILDQE